MWHLTVKYTLVTCELNLIWMDIKSIIFRTTIHFQLEVPYTTSICKMEKTLHMISSQTGKISLASELCATDLCILLQGREKMDWFSLLRIRNYVVNVWNGLCYHHGFCGSEINFRIQKNSLRFEVTVFSQIDFYEELFS